MIKNPKLKVGLLLNSFDAYAWEYLMVSKILACENVELSLIVKKQVQFNRQYLHQKIRKRHKYFLYSLYRRFENALIKNKYNAFEKADLSPLLAGISSIDVKCIEKKYSDSIIEEDVNKIKGYNIDVFVRLGFRILRGEILNVAKYGVWSLHHGDNLINRGGPPGVWEVIEQQPVTGVTLQILTEDLDAGQVLFRSWSKTDVFFNRNNNNIYWKSASFVARKLNYLYAVGWDKFIEDANKQNEEPLFYSNKLYTEPQNTLMFDFILKHFVNIFLLKLQELFTNQQWFLLYHFNTKNKISFSLFKFKRLFPPKDRFWADPFILLKDGKYYIFVEELLFKSGKGHIAVLEMDKKGTLINSQQVLNKPYHLSYPFIIEDNNEIYMIPETSSNKTIELYKCIDFPYKWEFVMNLIDNVIAVDTTVIYKENRYWLFTNIQENLGASKLDELFLFSSDSLLSSNWKSHPCNPIVSDVRRSRPAGALFYYNEKLYRPSQDSSVRYGYSININEIKIISETEYKELKVSGILPVWDKRIIGTHTFSYSHGVTVIDGERNISKI